MLKLYKMEKDGCLTVVLAGEMDTITSVNAEREIGVVNLASGAVEYVSA